MIITGFGNYGQAPGDEYFTEFYNTYNPLMPTALLPQPMMVDPALVQSVPQWKAKCASAGGIAFFDETVKPNGKWICKPSVKMAQQTTKTVKTTVAIAAGVGALALLLLR